MCFIWLDTIREGYNIRLSCDYRFQPADEDIEEKSLMPHCTVLEWDEIYKDWTNEHIADYEPRLENGLGTANTGSRLGVDVDIDMIGDPLYTII